MIFLGLGKILQTQPMATPTRADTRINLYAAAAAASAVAASAASAAAAASAVAAASASAAAAAADNTGQLVGTT